MPICGIVTMSEYPGSEHPAFCRDFETVSSYIGIHRAGGTKPLRLT